MSFVVSKVRKWFSKMKKGKKTVELPAEPDVEQTEVLTTENIPSSSTASDHFNVDKKSGSSSKEEEQKADKNKQDSIVSSSDEDEGKESEESNDDPIIDNFPSVQENFPSIDETPDLTAENRVSVELEEEEKIYTHEIFKIELHCFQDDKKMPSSSIKLLKKNEGGPTEYSSISLKDLSKRLTQADKKDIWVTIRIDKNYSIEVDDDDSLPAVSNLLDLVYPWMTKLSINDKTGDEFCFFDYDAPKLRHLSFGSTRRQLTFSGQHPPIPRSALSRIETLSFLHGTPNTRCVLDIQDLLTTTPALKEIWAIPLGYRSYIAEYLNNNDKLGLIKSIDCECENLDMLQKRSCMEILAKYAGQLRLEKLVCLDEPILKTTMEVEYWKEYCKFFSIVLDGTAKSLLKLEIRPRSDPSADLIFLQQFSALKTLVLSDPSNGLRLNRRFFRPLFDMNQTFPVLENVEIIGFTGRGLWLDDFILPHESLDNVKSLKLWKSPLVNATMYGVFIQDFVKLFPFVKSLEIGGSKEWLGEECLPFLWTSNSWTSLEELCVRVEHNSEMSCLAINNLDEVITGIHEDDCMELREGQTEEDLERLRTRCGISNMKNLKRFSIIVDIKSHPENPESIPSPCISAVSSVAGFKLVSGLEVSLKIPFRNRNKEVVKTMFGPIIPFVNFDPNYDEE